ncbi:hypothetical protein ACFP81_10260 [Deinococcus lacus]|uniref:Uncharacterized protein n=1 Tax=Deinococcus lacus TaxID=392561 RepID=A0ABW1YE91_9DEIO
MPPISGDLCLRMMQGLGAGFQGTGYGLAAFIAPDSDSGFSFSEPHLAYQTDGLIIMGGTRLDMAALPALQAAVVLGGTRPPMTALT